MVGVRMQKSRNSSSVTEQQEENLPGRKEAGDRPAEREAERRCKEEKAGKRKSCIESLQKPRQSAQRNSGRQRQAGRSRQ